MHKQLYAKQPFQKRGTIQFYNWQSFYGNCQAITKKFNASSVTLTIEQWSVLYHLWKEDGRSQQDLCNATFRDKPSITRLVDNLEKQALVKRVADEKDRRINKIFLTKAAQKLEEETMQMAEDTLNEALEGVPAEQIELCKNVLQKVYENLSS